MRVAGPIAGVSDHERGRARRLLQSIRKEIPEALAEGQDHDDAEVAAMLRELGIALVECEQPTQLVAARLLTIANQSTGETVRVVVLPTALVVEVGTVAYEVETIVKPTTQLNLAGRIDAIAELAEVGAITPADATREAAAARTTPGVTPPLFGASLSGVARMKVRAVGSRRCERDWSDGWKPPASFHAACAWTATSGTSWWSGTVHWLASSRPATCLGCTALTPIWTSASNRATSGPTPETRGGCYRPNKGPGVKGWTCEPIQMGGAGRPDR